MAGELVSAYDRVLVRHRRIGVDLEDERPVEGHREVGLPSALGQRDDDRTVGADELEDHGLARGDLHLALYMESADLVLALQVHRDVVGGERLRRGGDVAPCGDYNPVQVHIGVVIDGDVSVLAGGEHHPRVRGGPEGPCGGDVVDGRVVPVEVVCVGGIDRIAEIVDAGGQPVRHGYGPELLEIHIAVHGHSVHAVDGLVHPVERNRLAVDDHTHGLCFSEVDGERHGAVGGDDIGHLELDTGHVVERDALGVDMSVLFTLAVQLLIFGLLPVLGWWMVMRTGANSTFRTLPRVFCLSKCHSRDFGRTLLMTVPILLLVGVAASAWQNFIYLTGFETGSSDPSEQTAAALLAEDEKRSGEVSAMFEDMEYNILRASILNDGVRTDGRKVTEIRPITCEVGLLPCTHGSALFTRGETQSLAVTTLGTVQDEQLFDTIDGEKTYSNFMLHYNFPPYSVGEVGRLTTGRREIGHGHLAQRALEAVIPPKDEFPYTIRVVSEIMESNGSSSMASVCGGCLSLMDAGVPIKKPVAGIAMGLITEGADYARYTILSDILGEEDHLGDMDFKVAGTKDGITAFQMDIKIAGVTPEIMRKALNQAKEGRMHILGIMQQTLAAPRSEISELAPKILTVKVPEDKIGAVIGTGGKTIKSIAAQSNAEINIDDDGTVMIYGRNNASAQEAKRLVLSIIEEPEVGKIYKGTVKRIVDFGAFIEILPGKEGLCHISKLARTRVKNVSDVLSVGQEVDVKLIEIDRMGRLNLSYIDAQQDADKKEEKK